MVWKLAFEERLMLPKVYYPMRTLARTFEEASSI